MKAPDCQRCGWPADTHNPQGQCTRWPRAGQSRGEPGRGIGRSVTTGVLFGVGLFLALAWLLSSGAAANCSTMAELNGATCYPIAATVHVGSGWLAILCLAGGLLSALTGRTRG